MAQKHKAIEVPHFHNLCTAAENNARNKAAALK
ncbi:MAG: hypothetical protein RIR12_478 [Bacteroidota bacterium]|jgi:hypothetical protein